MKRSSAIKWLTGAIATVAVMAASVPAYAQGCAMCYNTAAAAKANAIQSLKSGTLVLLIPVLLLFAGIVGIAFRSRNRFNEPEPLAPPAVPGAENEWAEIIRASEFERLPAIGEESRMSDGPSARPTP